MFGGGDKIKIDKDLLEKVKKFSVIAGYSSPEEFVHHVARYSDDETLPKLYDFARSLQESDTTEQASLLRSLFRAAEERGAELPRDISRWGVGLARRLLESEGVVFDRAGHVNFDVYAWQGPDWGWLEANGFFPAPPPGKPGGPRA